MKNYAVQDWLEDWTYFAAQHKDANGQKPGTVSLGLKYFRQKYEDDPFGRFARFQKAQEFWAEYVAKFAKAKGATEANGTAAALSPETGVGRKLTLALHRLFSNPTDAFSADRHPLPKKQVL
jgi:hypothetical protein